MGMGDRTRGRLAGVGHSTTARLSYCHGLAKPLLLPPQLPADPSTQPYHPRFCQPWGTSQLILRAIDPCPPTPRVLSDLEAPEDRQPVLWRLAVRQLRPGPRCPCLPCRGAEDRQEGAEGADREEEISWCKENRGAKPWETRQLLNFLHWRGRGMNQKGRNGLVL